LVNEYASERAIKRAIIQNTTYRFQEQLQAELVAKCLRQGALASADVALDEHDF
jgi:hypothetical protein